MTPTPSITSTSTLLKPEPIHTNTPTLTPTATNATSSPRKHKPTPFRSSHAFFKTYLTLRLLSISLATLNLCLLIPSVTYYRQKRWMDPTLSPTLTTLIHSAVDVFVIWKWKCRAHYSTRAVYDGAIAAGCAVAAGFLGQRVVNAVRADGTAEGAGVLGGFILGGLVLQVLVLPFFFFLFFFSLLQCVSSWLKRETDICQIHPCRCFG